MEIYVVRYWGTVLGVYSTKEQAIKEICQAAKDVQEIEIKPERFVEDAKRKGVFIVDQPVDYLGTKYEIEVHGLDMHISVENYLRD